MFASALPPKQLGGVPPTTLGKWKKEAPSITALELVGAFAKPRGMGKGLGQGHVGTVAAGQACGCSKGLTNIRAFIACRSALPTRPVPQA